MIAIVLAEGEYIAASVIYCLYKCGVNSLVIGSESVSSLVLLKGCQKFLSFKHGTYTSYPMELIDLINFIAYKYKPLIVIPTGSVSVQFLSSYKDHISITVFPVPSMDMFDNLNNKWKFSQLLKRIGLPQPDTYLLEESFSLDEVEFPLPLVSKQLCGRSGEDIYYLNNKESLLTFLKCNDKKLFPMILQEYIPGYDIDLSVLSLDGQIIAWTIQRWKEPGVLQFVKEMDILRLGQQLIHEIKFSGVAHFDLRYDKRDSCFKFIECNPRFWGSLKASCCCGVNFPYIGLQYVLRFLPNTSLNQNSPQDTLWMTFSGLLRSFKSWDGCRKITVPAVRSSLREIGELWFINYKIKNYIPKISLMLVSLYNKWVKKIDAQQ